MKLVKPLVGAAGLALATGVALPSIGASGNKYDAGTFQTQVCDSMGNDNTVALVGAEKLWPPNHKFVDESVVADDASDGDASLSVAPSAQDAAGGDGGPQHDPDYTPSEIPTATGDPAVVSFALRSERSGKGDGRTYIIDWFADFSDGSSCGSMGDPNNDGATPVTGYQQKPAFTVDVPHDMRGGADWKAIGQ